MNFTVRPATESDRDWMLEIVRSWGADFVVTRGRKVYAAELPAFIAEDASHVGRIQTHSETGGRGGLDNHIRKVGLLTYEIIGNQCEIVTLDAFTQWSGIGTALMKRAVDHAREQGCKRFWFITTNDNLDAIRFYQKRGFTIAAVHVNAIAHSRELKPSIPEIGNYGIPLRDEIEFEMGL